MAEHDEMPVRRGACGDCRFFARLETQCRKNPPIPVLVQVGGGQTGFLQAFPPAKPSDWCGEFQRAPVSAPL